MRSQAKANGGPNRDGVAEFLPRSASHDADGNNDAAQFAVGGGRLFRLVARTHHIKLLMLTDDYAINSEWLDRYYQPNV